MSSLVHSQRSTWCYRPVTSVSPGSGATAGGTVVTIGGTGFANGAAVTIGGVPAPTQTLTDTAITVTTGPHAGGTVNVVVTNPSTSSGTRNQPKRKGAGNRPGGKKRR